MHQGLVAIVDTPTGVGSGNLLGASGLEDWVGFHQKP